MSDLSINGYHIVPEGHGFYEVIDPLGATIGSCEGSYTAREMARDHQLKVYRFYARNSDLSPLRARAAHLLTNEQAEAIIHQLGDSR